MLSFSCEIISPYNDVESNIEYHHKTKTQLPISLSSSSSPHDRIQKLYLIEVSFPTYSHSIQSNLLATLRLSLTHNCGSIRL